MLDCPGVLVFLTGLSTPHPNPGKKSGNLNKNERIFFNWPKINADRASL
jgi:hypothetical protein